MSELFKIHILSSNIRTCFFYLNDSNIKYYERNGCAIKIKYGTDRQNVLYGCISMSTLSEVPDKCIGVASLYANTLGLEEGEVVLLSNCNVDSVESLQILPKKEEDYVILLSCKSLLEAYLLNQVSVVAEGQILPLYVFSNISIKVEIGKLSLETGYGQLEKFTEIMVLHPSEKLKSSNKGEDKSNIKYDLKTGRGNLCSHFYNQLNEILNKRINISQINEQKNADTFLKHLMEESLLKNVEYKIQPSFLYLDNTLKKIQNRFIIVSNLDYAVNTFGPYCIKILAKVEKVTNNVKEKTENDGEKKKENLCLYNYVICLNNYGNNIAFCPAAVMKKLKLYVGSKITIECIRPGQKTELPKWSERINYDDEDSKCFWNRIETMRENVRLTLTNNFQYNYKINTLIVGGQGMGKTFLLNDILNEFSKKFIFCKIFHCKTLRGKKVETLHKLWLENLRECASQEPSLLLLDDLQALTYIDEEEGQFNRLYSDRIVDLISDMLENFQGKYNISVVATALNMSQLATLVTRYGPRLFHYVLTIPEMNVEERNFALKSIINNKIGISKDYLLDLDKLSSSTNGYTIQDLNDLVDKAIFNCLLRNETDDDDVKNINQSDFDLAVSESTPLNLRDVKLKQNISIKWENVGGMEEPKKILMEVFSWPLKYSNILESCPLRLQRGVLLYGAPGTGKTLLAGALANKCGLNFISVKGPELLSKYVGASEEGVRNLFLQAQKTQPCLLFFDEFDSLAPKRGHDNTGVTDRVVNQLLTQLDGVESLNGVWVLAATSRPDLLDSALLRPGRLDKMVLCDLPNQTGRLSILEVLARNVSISEDVNLLEIANKSEGYTGADLQAIFYNAQMLAIKEEKNLLGNKSVIKIKQIHLLKALSELKPSLSQSEKMRYEKIYEKFLNSRKRNFVESYEGEQRVTFA